MTSERPPLDESPLSFLTHHVVVPAAVIAMVASFLFYLVDVRSAYLGGGASLKWIGFCFVVATVLIERYDRATRARAEADLQGCYTGALAAATIAVMIAAPWDPEAGKAGQVLANLLIVGVVWHFATRVTRELSPEIDRAPRPRRTLPQIYGGPSLPVPETKTPPASVRNPAARVAQLAAIALLIFALTEPILLAAVPQTGIKALAAVVIFLFSTGVVLAAGSTLETLRRAERAGAEVHPGLVPGRVALAGLLLAMLLASGLALPGLDYQGTGRLKPPPAHGKGVEENRGNQETLDPGQPSETMPEGDLGEELALPVDPSQPPAPGGSLDETPPPSPPRSESAPSPGPAAGLLSLLARIGKLLLIPLILAFAGAALWGLIRLWPLLAGWRSRAASRWRAFLDRLAGLLSRPRQTPRSSVDPFKSVDALLDLSSRETVLAAYHRFLLLLESLGHERPGKATPYEILAGLPPHLKPLEAPARTLTDLYVLAAYAADPVEPGAPERSVAALKSMRGLVERMA